MAARDLDHLRRHRRTTATIYAAACAKARRCDDALLFVLCVAEASSDVWRRSKTTGGTNTSSYAHALSHSEFCDTKQSTRQNADTNHSRNVTGRARARARARRRRHRRQIALKPTHRRSGGPGNDNFRQGDGLGHDHSPCRCGNTVRRGGAGHSRRRECLCILCAAASLFNSTTWPIHAIINLVVYWINRRRGTMRATTGFSSAKDTPCASCNQC